MATSRPTPHLSPAYAAALRRLATYRLERGLTFEALGAEMTAAGYPIPGRALHLMLTHRLKTYPRETTLYKIAQFVAHLPRDRRTA